MGHPRQPGSDPEAHLRLAQKALELTKENKRLRAELDALRDLEGVWTRGRADMRSYLGMSGVEVHYLYPPDGGARIPILGSEADNIDPQDITARLVDALNARARRAEEPRP